MYACRRCEQEVIRTPIITAPMPGRGGGRSASPSILAYIMSQKYVDSLPLYRQEQQLLAIRCGVIAIDNGELVDCR